MFRNCKVGTVRHPLSLKLLEYFIESHKFFTYTDIVGADESKKTEALEDVSWLAHWLQLKRGGLLIVRTWFLFLTNQPMQVIVSSCLAISGYHGHMRSGSLKVRLLRKKDTDKDKKGKKTEIFFLKMEFLPFLTLAFGLYIANCCFPLPIQTKN